MADDETKPLLGSNEAVGGWEWRRKEAWLLLRLAVPIFISRCGWVGMKVTDSAVLGHVGTEYLAASGVSDLWTMVTGIFVQDMTVGVLCSQAYGAGKYAMLGVWCSVGFTVLMIVNVPVFIAWNLTTPVLIYLGTLRATAVNAGYYASVLSLILPLRSFTSLTTAFLQSQKILDATVVGSLTAFCTNLILSLTVVLYLGYGFRACPIMTDIAEVIQVSILIGYYFWYLKVHEKCWEGFGGVTCNRVKVYLGMQVPAVLQVGSDFWRMAVVGGFAAMISEVDVAVFNASYRILWVVLTFVGAVGNIAGIRIGIKLGEGKPMTAKAVAYTGTLTAFTISTTLAGFVYFNIRFLSAVFSPDPSITAAFATIRAPLAFTTLFMTLSVFLERIPIAAGHSHIIFKYGFIASWAVQVPLVALFYYQSPSLHSIYQGVACGYLALCVLFQYAILNLDWEADSITAIKRSQEH